MLQSAGIVGLGCITEIPVAGAVDVADNAVDVDDGGGTTGRVVDVDGAVGSVDVEYTPAVPVVSAVDEYPLLYKELSTHPLSPVSLVVAVDVKDTPAVVVPEASWVDVCNLTTTSSSF